MGLPQRTSTSRGEQTLPIDMLRKLATATGVRQASLVNTAKGASKPTTASTTTVSNANISMRVTSSEKHLITYYRKADSDTKKAATNVLKGKCGDLVPSLIDRGTTKSGRPQDSISDMSSGALGVCSGINNRKPFQMSY